MLRHEIDTRCELNDQIQNLVVDATMSPREQYCCVSFGRRFFPLDSSSSKILSPVVTGATCVSDVYMCTKRLGPRAHVIPHSPLYIHFSSLNHLCLNRAAFPVTVPSIVAIPSFLPFRYLLFSVQREDMPMPRWHRCRALYKEREMHLRYSLRS